VVFLSDDDLYDALYIPDWYRGTANALRNLRVIRHTGPQRWHAFWHP
jgi:hypothetical protein